MTVLSTLVALTLVPINRFRGGGIFADRLPSWAGHPRYWATLMVLLAGWAMGGPLFGAKAAVSFLLWCLPPWGRWYTLGYAGMQPGPAGRKPTWFERTIERWTETMSEAFLWRQTLGFAPAAVLLSPWTLAAGVAAWAIYEISWMTAPAGREIQIAELGTGALWGVILLWAL